MGLFTSLCIFALIGSLLGDPDYYWRPYNGLIPDDAVLGRSVGGFNAYIGSTSVEQGVYVGELQGGITSLSIYAWTALTTITEHIEILCSGHPENFQWVQVDDATVFDIPVENRVVAGFTPKYNGTHTIAKERLDLPVGWALTYDDFERGDAYMCYTLNGTAPACSHTYYALAYYDSTTKEVEVKFVEDQ